jgi:RNA polymerase sigma-70 factor (ECF subfamily)
MSGTTENAPDAADVALALAAADGDEAALRRFDALVREVVPVAIASMKLDAARVDDVVQRVRERLLLAKDGEPPPLVRYAERGALRGLLAIVATRVAIETTRRDSRERGRQGPDGDAAGGQPTNEPGPELMLIKAEYRAAFREAYRGALASLEAHDKNLLRLHLVGGLTLAELATMYGQHRATVVRSLARIREAVLKATQRDLKQKLAVSERELSSLFGLAQSQLDVSVMSLLSPAEPPEE